MQIVTNAPTLDEVIKALDCRTESEVGYNQILLHEKYDLNILVPFYVDAFPKIKSWIGRNYILYWVCRYARINPAVVNLGRFAINDRSKLVRYRACQILSYALDKESIPMLEALLTHKNEETRKDAAAAIDAIKCQNHHFFSDRAHAGNIFWEPGKI